jgi:apolipoprotein N-acyltransferase
MRARNSYILALLSGILLFLSYPPCNLGFLAWFAFVPLLLATYYETRAKRIGKLTTLAAICLSPLFIWLYNEVDVFLPAAAAWPVGVILAIFMGIYILELPFDNWRPKNLPGRGLGYLPSISQIFVIPVLATAWEYLLMNIPVVMKIGGALGFFSISRTQWLYPPILQLASFTGMYGLTFLILLVNVALAWGIIHYKDTRRISMPAIAVLVIFLVIFAVGWIGIPESTSGDVNVAVIQAKPSEMEKQSIDELYTTLTEDSLKYEPDIILWPIWMQYEPLEPLGPSVKEHVDFSTRHGVYLIDAENIVSPDGNIGNYDAPYLFPHVFDGFIPFDTDKIMPWIHGFNTDFGKTGILLCMESASTLPARQLVDDGVQFIVATSADRPVIGAFQGLIGGNLAYRAVEHRIYTALFFGSGGSAVFDPYGRKMKDIAPEEEIVVSKIAFTGQRTFYTKYGDIFGWIITGLLILLLGSNLYLKRRSPFKYCKECLAQIPKDSEICENCGAGQKKPPLWKRILLHEYYEHIDRYRDNTKTKPK